MTSSSNDGRRKRYALLAAAAILALGGVAAITTAAVRHSSEPAETAGIPAVAPDSTSAAPRPGTASDVLTSGPLMASSPPTRVSIPALRVSVPVVGLGQQADGAMEVPTDATTVGWYTKAPTPGSLGPAILAGHVDFKKKPGTFAHLSTMKAGDAVTVAREDGTTATFAVTKVERYAKNRFPSEAVYGAIDHAGLRLITCGGDFDSTAGHYEDNIVVYATLRDG